MATEEKKLIFFSQINTRTLAKAVATKMFRTAVKQMSICFVSRYLQPAPFRQFFNAKVSVNTTLPFNGSPHLKQSGYRNRTRESFACCLVRTSGIIFAK